ncbi:MAG: MFS transporter [Acidimicrobiales bacterium]
MTDASALAVPSTNGASGEPVDPYKGKWGTLSNTTLGMLMASIDASIVLISLPDIFRGIHLNPLTAGNTSYFLWILMGYMMVTAVLVVSFGRLGDIFGRVRMYIMGFVIFTVFSVMLSLTWMHGPDAALFMIIMRVCQGVGAAFIWANSTAILTDAFPPNQRGLALGTNMIAAIAGSFIGLVLGGLLGPIDWRLIFWISVPVGVVGTVWGIINLEEKGIRTPAKIDWVGNATFAVGLVAVLVGIVYGIEPYGRHTMGWTSPFVLGCVIGGVAVLCLFVWIETKVAAPMFRIPLFRIRNFAAGNVAALMSALGRGGLMFILIIWLQGIWLPEHGYSFTQTPLWAGIFMLPLTGGFLISGPLSGYLSDHFGARPFAVGGMLGAAGSFVLLELLPIDFSYGWFGLLLLTNGLAMGLFASPNRAAVMNSLPPDQRGQGAGMGAVMMNSSMVLSIGIFFTLIIVGLSGTLPTTLFHGLTAHGVPPAAAHKVASLPPTSSVFAAFLGYNPIQQLLGPSGTLARLPHAQAAYLTGRSFFPSLVAGPFAHGLHEALDFAAGACLLAACASLTISKKYFYEAPSVEGSVTPAAVAVASVSASERPVEAVEAAHDGDGHVELSTADANGHAESGASVGGAGGGRDRNREREE